MVEVSIEWRQNEKSKPTIRMPDIFFAFIYYGVFCISFFFFYVVLAHIQTLHTFCIDHIDYLKRRMGLFLYLLSKTMKILEISFNEPINCHGRCLSPTIRIANPLEYCSIWFRAFLYFFCWCKLLSKPNFPFPIH